MSRKMEWVNIDKGAPAMTFLSAFGDEIAPALDDQIEVLISKTSITQIPDGGTLPDPNDLWKRNSVISERLDMSETKQSPRSILRSGKVAVDVSIDE